jgi:predicted secreted protein
MVRQGTNAVAAGILVGLSLMTPVLAGDRAAISLLGFSEDGRYFAFEEFGVQDGSGFPFSSIQVIDLVTDKWVAGAPFKARIDDETARQADARSEAAAQANGPMADAGISVPAEFIALNGDGEPMDGKSLPYGGVGYGFDQPRDVRVVTLETLPLPAPKGCPEQPGTSYAGFALQQSGVELHRDASIPASRACPMDYRIYGIVAPFGGEPSVAIVSVYSLGFEGPDRRFIAVPTAH